MFLTRIAAISDESPHAVEGAGIEAIPILWKPRECLPPRPKKPTSIHCPHLIELTNGLWGEDGRLSITWEVTFARGMLK
jgi:hypothetical protein